MSKIRLTARQKEILTDIKNGSPIFAINSKYYFIVDEHDCDVTISKATFRRLVNESLIERIANDDNYYQKFGISQLGIRCLENKQS